ncbi:chitin synthase c [Trichoderma arundinaceum]|uniref:Chitin synthase c n=1 Tax=Trichoderma arundinaceum TaxID=490622 RepID=A0A395NNS5_TRIAR|nr:chitin synthase c [Trichoderma arundinaceum]
MRHGIRTGFANEEEEPDAAREVEDQGHGIARVAQQIDDAEEGAVQLGPEPARLDGRGVEDGMRRRLVGAGGSADEGRREAPGEADEDEAQDVVDGRGAVALFGRR